MRKNKKLLLGGLSVLTLVAAGSGAVSTFAWYSASLAGNKAAETLGTGDLTAAATDPEYTIASDLPVKVTVARSGSGKLELGHWFPANDVGLVGKKDYAGKTYVSTEADNFDAETQVKATAGYYHAYIDGNSVVHYGTTKLSELADFAKYTITITAPDANVTVDGVTWTPSQVAAALNNSTAQIVIASNTSNAKFLDWDGSSNPTPAAGADPKTISSVTLTNLGTTGTVRYFALYVDGETGSPHDADVSGNFTVTVTGTAAAPQA